MNPEDFQPIYDNSVIESIQTNNGVISVNINEQYCLMPASALALLGILRASNVGGTSDPQMVFLPPVTQAPGSPFQFNHDVPWFKWANGTLRNAGQLATYWGMAGVPRAQALAYAIIDINTPVEGQ